MWLALLCHMLILGHASKPSPKLPAVKLILIEWDGIPIKLAKIKDISKLFPYVPEYYQKFYRQIVENCPKINENDDD